MFSSASSSALHAHVCQLFALHVHVGLQFCTSRSCLRVHLCFGSATRCARRLVRARSRLSVGGGNPGSDRVRLAARAFRRSYLVCI